MREDAFEQPYLCVDATGVLVQHPEKCRRGHFWVLVAPERHVLFEYTPEHTGDAVDDVLAGYKGHLVADAHTVYDHLYENVSVRPTAFLTSVRWSRTSAVHGTSGSGNVGEAS